MKPLTIALPKGRLLGPAATLFRNAGWRCDVGNGSRQLLVSENRHDKPDGQELRLMLAKAADVPVYVEYGAADVGIVGQDVLVATGQRVATKYPRLALSYFRKLGLSVEIIPLTGSIELAPLAGLADLVVDVVETGRTLRENGLVELAEILSFEATLIVNRASYRLRLGEIRGLLADLGE